MTSVQFGQPQHFVFEIEHSASVSLRIIAVVGGKSAVALSCTDPEPNAALLADQLARADFMRAIGAILI
jgi:hypothetical protein